MNRFQSIFLPALIAVVLGYAATVSAAPVLYSVRSNANDHLYSIDAATGVATDLGALTFGDAEGLAFVGSTLYAIGGTDDQFWNITTPPGTLVGATGARTGIDAGLDYNRVTGTMYNYNAESNSGALYTINLATGAATLVGSNNTYADGLAIDSGGLAYAANGTTLYSIDLATAAATVIGSLGLGNSGVQVGLTFGDDDLLYAIASDGALYTVNTATGAATLAANITCEGIACAGWEGLATQSAAPEPGTLALLGAALLGLGMRRRVQ